MSEIENFYNVLTEDEINYLKSLMNDKSQWVWKNNYDDITNNGGKLYFDAITPDYNKLTNYHKFVCQNEKYIVAETALNIISKDRQNKNTYHYDVCDLSFVTYLNDDFVGGNFNYYNKEKEKFSVSPKIGMTLKINKDVFHEVDEVIDGTRFSLYTFLLYTPKKNKTIL